MCKKFASIALALVAMHGMATGLPEPSRTVYKCVEGKKVYYSDSPCLGAQRIEIQPTRGLNKLTGRELTGADVYSEQRREQIARAVKPLTGMDDKQFAQLGRRTQLSSQAQQQCRKLDAEMPQAEAVERQTSDPKSLVNIQNQLFNLRRQYRELRCD